MSKVLYLIWWLRSDEATAIVNRGHMLPIWLHAEVRSLSGRVPRGRLWVAQHLDIEVKVDPWPESALGDAMERCGGVVITHNELRDVEQLPGFLTTLDGRRVGMVSRASERHADDR